MTNTARHHPPRFTRSWVCTLLASASLLSAARPALALKPEEIVVLFNTKSANSLAVARYYQAARKLPPQHIIPITCDVSENISEQDYRAMVVPQLIKGLTERKLMPDEKAGIAGIKCIVTTYDLPLRVTAHQPTVVERGEIAEYEARLNAITVELGNIAAAFDKIAPPGPVPATARAPAEKPTWQQSATRAGTAAQNAGLRIERIPPAGRAPALQEFIRLQERSAGIAGVVNSLRVPANAPDNDPGRQQLAQMSAQVRELQTQYAAVARQIDSARMRKELVEIRLKAEGLIGQARALDEVIGYLRPEQTESCLDNELALALADQSYPRRLWATNPKNVENWPNMQRQPAGQVPKTLMVARLDGSTVAKAQELVDIAMEVEAKGLDGKIYLDARGLHGTDGYAAFDSDLRRAAEWLKEHATMEMVLDDKPELLAAHAAPDAAVYCGWYSLKQYQESGQWVKGAVGYHVASLEMTSLHTPNETGWVVNLLNRGFGGTLGATDEPYLNSFPKPSLFIPLLLSGEFTQGEVWQVTSPMLSWRVGFVGDPLYNPFKARPRVKVEDIKKHTVLRNAYDILGR